MNKIKTMFIGTSNFAVPLLESLLDWEYLDITCVVTQPDRPVGRKQILTPPPVKQLLKNKNQNIPIEQPEKVRKVGQELMEQYQPELILVASYGQIIPKNMLDYPMYGCLNVHVSKLPHLRGAVPMPMAILEGLEETGVTLQVMAEGLDEGDIIDIQPIKISDDETAESLEQKSARASIEQIKRVLPKWVDGEVSAKPQDHTKATFCSIKDLAKKNAQITYDLEAEHVERMVRAFYPWPIAWMLIPEGDHLGKRLKIYEARLSKEVEREGDKLFLFSENNRLFLNLEDGVLELLEVQLEGKQRKVASEYLYLA